MRQLILQLMSREKRGLKSGSHKSYFNFLQSSNPTATKYPKHGAKVHFSYSELKIGRSYSNLGSFSAQKMGDFSQ